MKLKPGADKPTRGGREWRVYDSVDQREIEHL